MPIDLLADNDQEQAQSAPVDLLADKLPPLPLGKTLLRAGRIAGEDIAKIPGEIGNTLASIAKAAPTQIPGYFNQAIHDPQRVANNLLTGVGDVERNAANISSGSSLANYLAHLGLISDSTAKTFRHQNENVIGESVADQLGNEKPGDTLIQNANKVLGFNPELPGTALSTAKSLPILAGDALESVTGKKRLADLKESLDLPGKNANLNMATAKRDQSLSAKELADADLEAKKTALEKANEAAKIETGISDPASMANRLDKSKNLVDRKNNEVEGLNHLIDNVINPPEAPELSGEAQTKAEEATRQREEGEQAFNAAADMSKRAEDALHQTDTAIGGILNKNAKHKVNVSRGLNQVFKDEEKGAQADYKKVMDAVSANNFQLPNVDKYHIDLSKQLRTSDAANKVNFNNPTFAALNPDLAGTSAGIDNPFLQQIYSKAPTAQDSDAKTFLTKLKDFIKERYDTIRDLKNPNITASEREQRIEAYDKSKELHDIIQRTLTEGLGEHAEPFNAAQARYRDTVFPLRNNAIIQRTQKTGKLSSNILDEISGEPGDPRFAKGQELVRQIVKQNPHILKDVIAQQYKKNPSLIHNPDDLMKEYLPHLQELTPHLEKHEIHSNLVKMTGQNLDHAEKMQKALIKQEQDFHKLAADAIKAHDSELKQHEATKSQYEVDRNKYKQQVNKAVGTIQNHLENIARYEKHLPVLRARAADNKLSLNEHMKAVSALKKEEAALKEAKSARNKAVKKLESSSFGVPGKYKSLKMLARGIMKLKGI